jgi:hypothetical protein
MDPGVRAPNMVPKGAVRLSEAFDQLCGRLAPDWHGLSDACVRWDEAADLAERTREDLWDDPYNRVFEVSYRAEIVLRSALAQGKLKAYVHDFRTGIDFELYPRDWKRTGEVVGINSDYTDDRMPGPDCRLNGIARPVFLSNDDFQQWLGAPKESFANQRNDEPSGTLDTRAFSLEQIVERTGLSRSKLYEEIEQRNLIAKKCGNRTLVLESELTRFLRGLPDT